jgi:hypothetical protein
MRERLWIGSDPKIRDGQSADLDGSGVGKTALIGKGSEHIVADRLNIACLLQAFGELDRNMRHFLFSLCVWGFL